MVSLHIVKHPRSRTGGKVQITKTDLLPSPFHVDDDDDDAAPSSSSSTQQLRGPLRRVCLVCKAKASSYSCPRCATPYCSAACYKGHNQDCTEGFYRQHVEKEMKLQEAEGQGSADAREARKATIDALRRVRLERKGTGDKYINNNHLSSGEADDEEEEGMMVDEDRLESLLARGDALDFDALTPGEQRAFLAAVASGELGKAVEVWTPWWIQTKALSSEGKPLVLLEEAEAASQPDTTHDAPVDFDTLFHQLENEKQSQKQKLKKQPTSSAASPSPSAPSPLLKYHLLDLLFAYVTLLRTYNGCWAVAPEEAAQDLISLSTILQQQPSSYSAPVAPSPTHPSPPTHTPIESAAGALSSSLTTLRQWQQQESSSLAMGISLAEDVGKLLQHPALAQAALLDASRVVRAAMVEVLQINKDKNEEKEEDLAKLLASKLHFDKKDSSKSATSSKEDKARRQAGKKLLRVWHKLRFFLQWSLGFTSMNESEKEDKESEWESLRAEYLTALKEQQEAVAGAGMVGKQKKEKEKMVVL